MLLLLHAIIPCLHTWIVCGSVNSELRAIYISSVWSFHNHCAPLRLSCFFSSTIPTSFNILVKCFFYTCFTIFSWVPSGIHFCFFVELPSLYSSRACVRTSPTPFYFCGPARLSSTFLWNVERRCTYRKWLPTYKENFDYTVLSKVMKIFVVNDHAHNGKELFCVKTIESTCATLAVGQCNWRRRRKRRKW